MLKKNVFFLNTVTLLGVLDFMQRRENRKPTDLKQCMPVRKFVLLELALTLRHGRHQSSVIAFREQPAHSAGAFTPEQLQER